MKLWIYTDGTELSYPIYIEKSSTILARKCGVTSSTVRRAAWAFKNGSHKTSRYEVVEVEEDEDNDILPRGDNGRSRGY